MHDDASLLGVLLLGGSLLGNLSLGSLDLSGLDSLLGGRLLLGLLDLLRRDRLHGRSGSLLDLGSARLGHDLDDDHPSVVALAGTELHDAGVTTVAISPHALRGLVENLGHEILVAELGDSKAARVQVALLGPRDDGLGEAAERLCTGLGGLDAVIGDMSASARI